MPNAAPPGLVKDYAAASSVFQPAHLLREARRQQTQPDRDVPPVCVLNPDGNLVRHLRAAGRARSSPGWACYHTELAEFTLPDGTAAGIVGCAVGAPSPSDPHRITGTAPNRDGRLFQIEHMSAHRHAR